MNWKDIYRKNALKDEELHKRNGYNFLSEVQYNNMATELIKPLTFNESTKVLDAGCGCGSFAKVIATRGVVELTGVDYVQESVDVAKKHLPSYNFFCNSVDSMTDIKSNYYDVVTCNGVFLYLTNDSANKALSEIYRVLKVGGEAVISGINHIDKLNLYNELRKTTHARRHPPHFFLNEHFFEKENFELKKVLHYTDMTTELTKFVLPYRFAVYLKKVS